MKLFDHITLMAQAPQGQQQQPSSAPLLIGMVLFVAVFFIMTSRSQKKERTKKADMLNSLTKNDRVMTIGGIIGTVVNVKENEVTLKVDETTNTRMTFLKKSIQQVINSEEDIKSQAT